MIFSASKNVKLLRDNILDILGEALSVPLFLPNSGGNAD